MAITKIDNIGAVFNAEFHTGVSEGVAQAIDIVNAVSGGTIRIVPNRHRGDYKKEAFWKQMALVSRRDDTATTAPTPITMDQGEVIAVKVKRKAGPVEVSSDALVNVEADVAAAARIFGKQVGEQKIQDMLNSGLLAAEAAIQTVGASVNLDITAEATKTSSTSVLNRLLAKFGDRARAIRAFAMHSKPFFDVNGAVLAQNTYGITDVMTISGGLPGLLGRLALMSDAPALTDANGSLTDTYNTLGLVEGAIVLEESDPEIFAYGLNKTGKENIYNVLQAEYAFSLTIKGFKWDVTNGGRNPSDAAIGTGTNWDQTVTSYKDLAGVRLVTQ